MSAIAKTPVGPAPIALDTINLAGDDQADRTVHGGPDKSVYSYPSEHAADWQADGFAIEPGGVGENLVTEGAGAGCPARRRVAWGDARVQISQPARALLQALAAHRSQGHRPRA